MTDTINGITTLADHVLLENLTQLSHKENVTTIEILRYLAEVERRKLYLEQGFSSMFRFCTEGPLRYSEPAAQRRLICARALTRFPSLEPELLHKRLTLTTLSLVASQLTEQNLLEVVSAIAGKSREFVEQFRAGFRPEPKARRELIRPVVVQKPVRVEPTPLFAEVKDGSASLNSTSSSIASEQIEGIVSGNLAFAGEGSSLPAVPEPRFEIRFTIDAANHKKLQEAKALLLAKYPHGAGVEQVFAEALELLIEKRSPGRRHARRQKKAAHPKAAKESSKPTQHQPAPRLRPATVPAATRDAVFARDSGQCTYISPLGMRCSETADLELHHIVPRGRAGGNEESNITVRCRGHNLHQAFKDYGTAHMARYVNGG